MKRFEMRDVEAARAYAMAGGQALHVCPTAPFVRAGSPRVFKNSAEFAHLFDQDGTRLTETARKLGVRVVLIEKGGTPSQHVDLCAGPLERAKALAKDDERQGSLGL